MIRFLSPFIVTTALAAPVAAEGPGPMSGGIMGFAPWVMIFVIFYFLLIRPQQKQAKEQQKMIDALKRGDRILTQGGIYGTVHAVKGKVLEVKLSDEVKVLMTKAAVTQVVSGDPSQEAEPAAPSAKH